MLYDPCGYITRLAHRGRLASTPPDPFQDAETRRLGLRILQRVGSWGAFGIVDPIVGFGEAEDETRLRAAVDRALSAEFLVPQGPYNPHTCYTLTLDGALFLVRNQAA
jgi:hypothetical protein